MRKSFKHFLEVLAATAVMAACTPQTNYKWTGDELASGDVTIGRVYAGYSEGITARHSIECLQDGIFRLVWTFEATVDVEKPRIAVDFIHGSKADYWMIPSVSYNGNNWGKGKEPKGASVDGRWFSYSYRRTPIPGAVYSEGKNFAVATWSDVPANPESDFSCSVMPEEDATIHRLIWPEEEMPVNYCNRDRYAPGWQRGASLSKGEIIEMTQYICICPVKEGHAAERKFLDFCWKNISPRKRELPSPDTVWNLGIRYFSESLWAEEGPFRGFSIGLLPDKVNVWKQREGSRYEAGWCGQNISVACSFLQDYLYNGNKCSLEKGMATLDAWAGNCRLPGGLFICQFDQVLDGEERIIDACNLGTAAINFFEAYRLAAECGINRPDFRELALDICDFVVSDQQDDGCYAKGWRPDGECVYREGTVGCFLVPAMLEAYNISGESRYLESALRAYDHYVSGLRRDGFTTAGALDTWCIDKESAISLLRSSLRLYNMTGSGQYLDDALQSSYYLSTWLWHYDGVYPDDDAFTEYDYHPFGATSVSVQHHHLDYYATLWIPEWFELSELTGDNQWREKAKAIWNNCTQLISNGNLIVNGVRRPAGSQNEAYFESCWGFGVESSVSDPSEAAAMSQAEAPSVSRQDRINNWLVAWPGAFRLEVLRKLHDSYGWATLE